MSGSWLAATRDKEVNELACDRTSLFTETVEGDDMYLAAFTKGLRKLVMPTYCSLPS